MNWVSVVDVTARPLGESISSCLSLAILALCFLLDSVTKSLTHSVSHINSLTKSPFLSSSSSLSHSVLLSLFHSPLLSFSYVHLSRSWRWSTDHPWHPVSLHQQLSHSLPLPSSWRSWLHHSPSHFLFRHGDDGHDYGDDGSQAGTYTHPPTLRLLMHLSLFTTTTGILLVPVVSASVTRHYCSSI